MPQDLTNQKILDTYQQLLHLDGGATATDKVVFDGDGTAVGLKVSTGGIDASALKIAGTAVTATAAELNFVDGVTSNIQTQLNAKAGSLGDLGVTATATELNVLDGITASTVELNYTDGVTSSIQTQLNAKAPLANPSFTGTVVIPTADINGGTIDGVTLGANSPVTNAQIDNININGNTVSSTDTNGNIIFDPNGTGFVQEDVGGIDYNLVSQYDIGTAPNEIPLNQYLGSMAYQDAENIAGDVNIGGTINDSIKIDTNGNVGIGTVEPSSLLELYSDNPRITLSDLGTQAKITNLSGNLYYDTSSANRDHIFEGAGSEAARITGDGNVGIATTAPEYRLDITATDNVTTTMAMSVQNIARNYGVGIGAYTLSNRNIGGLVTSVDYTFDIGGAAIFKTGDAERMRITPTGNVGIGPEVGTTSSANQRLLVTASNEGAITYGLYIHNNSFSAGSARISLSPRFSFAYNTAPYVQSVSESTSAAALTFGTTASNVANERLRIDASGNLLLGTTSAYSGGRLSIVTTSNGIGINATGTSTSALAINTSSTTNQYVAWLYNGAQIASISTTGTAVSYNTTSDYRLKENVAPMTGALEKVQSLNPVTYTWKADGSAGQGFIAHELQAVVPDAVTGEKDAINADGSIKPQGVDTSFLVATLTAAIQELSAKVDTLQAELNTLKGN